MSWNIYDISEMESKWGVWDQLNELYYNSHPYFDSRFIRACVKHFGDKNIKLAQFESRSNDVEGMALVTRRSLASWSLFYTSQMQLLPILVHPRNYGKEIYDLIKYLPGFCWRLECLYQDPEYTPFNIHSSSLTNKYYHCTTTSIEIEDNFEQFWKKRKKSVKKNINRYFNRLEKEDIRIKFKKNCNANDLKNGLIRYGLLENVGWKGKAGTAIHPSNSQGLFYNEVLQSFSSTGQASIYELYFNDELAASRICINNNKLNIILKVTYNEQFKQYSPGKLLLYKVIENEFEEGEHQKIEFYTNASKDQINWASSTRDILHFEVYRNRIYYKLIQLKDNGFERWRFWKKRYEQ